MALGVVFVREMAACLRLGSKRAAALRPFLALFLAVALAVILQKLVFAAHTETTAISPANVTFVKNSTLRAFDFNVSWTGGADNITAINISLPSGFLLGSFGNLSGAGFFCSNVSALVNCSNSSAYGLNPAAPSVIIRINATPQVATGTYNWVINTTDTAAKINGSVVTTSVDSEAPTVAAPTVNVSSPTNLNTNFFINTSFNDTSPAGVNGSGVVACSYNVTNSTGGLVVSAPMNYSTGVVGFANATIQSILPEGNNSVFVNCTDNVTFTGYSLATILTVDLTPPSISIQSPANATYAALSIPLNFTAGDLNGISSCKYELANSSGLPVNYSLSNCGNVSSMSGVTEGSNSVRVWANDSAGNWNSSASVYFSVDTGYPSVTINSPANQSWQRGAVSVNYSATDTKTIDACSWRWKNSTGVWSSYTSLTCGSNLAFSFNTANCGDNATAACAVEVRANDTANNVNSTEVYLKVDNTAPVVNVSQPASGWFNGSVLVRITVNDSTSGTSSVIFYNGSAWASAVSESGNSYNGVWNGTINTAAFSDGTSIQINANATDSAGNNGSDASVPTIQVDNNPPKILNPTLNVSGPTNRNTNIFVNSTFNDTGGQGLAADSCQLYITGATSVSAYAINNSAGASGAMNGTISATLNDGTNNIYLNCTDQQGWTGSNYTSLVVDTVPPGIAIQSPIANNYSTAIVPLNFTAGDANGVSSCRYELTNSSGSFNTSLANCQNATLTGVTEDGNSVKVWANDSAGNWNVSASVSFTVDTIFPACSAFSANVSYARNGESVNFTATCNDTGTNISRVFFNLTAINSSVGVVQASPVGGNSYYYAASVGASDGPKTISIFNVSDNAGNVNSSLVPAASVIVDNTAPVVAASSPANDSWTNDNTTSFQFTATDNLAAYTNCTLFVDSAGKGSNSSVANNTPTTIVSTELLEGARSWQVNCSDAAGNLNQSGARVLNVDVSNPASAITFPPALSWTSNATPLINFTLTDNLDVVLNYTVFVGGANVSAGAVANNTPQAYALPAQGEGSHVVRVEALDEAGNRANSSAVTIVVDYTNPSVANASVNVSAAKAGTPVNVSAVVTDANLNASRLFVYNSTGAATLMLPQGGNVYTALITVTETGDNPSLQYNISAYDNASNVNGSMYVAFNLDNTAPAVYAPSFNMSSPTRFNANLFINASFNDTALSGVNGSGVSKCTYNVTNSSGAVVSWASMNSSGGVVGVANATITTPLPDGPNSIYVNCSDAVGWVGYSNATVLTVDTIAPAWNQTPSSQVVEYGTAFYYQINASDLYLNKYSISDSANFTINPATGAIQNITFLPIGAHPLTAYVNDTAGNQNSSSFTVNVSDTIFPVVSSITTTPSTSTAGTAIIINATISDVPPLVVKAKIQYVNKTNYAVIDYALLNMSASGNNYNATWNTAGAYNGTYVVDINVTDGGGNNVIVNDGASIALGFGAQSAYSNSSVSTDSLNQTTVTSANISIQIQANNSRQNESVTIVKYSSDPSGSSLANSFGATEIGAFTDIVSSISGSNLTWALIKIYYTEPSWDENKLGVYYWNGTRWQKLITRMTWVYGVGINTTGNYVWANVSHLSLFAAAGDTQGPQASQILLSRDPTASNVTFTAMIDDTASGGSDVSAAEYYLNSSSPPLPGSATPLYPQDGLGFDGNRTEVVNGSINIDALTDGAHTIYVRGMDAANNWGAAAYYTFTVNKTAPTLSSISISNNAVYATSASVTLSLSASGAYECAFSNDNSAYSAWESYSAIKPWLLSSGDGTKTVYYKCKNSAGLEASPIPDTIILDTAAPSINITAPAAGATANGNYSINFSISDANGVSPQNVSISFDGAEWISTGSNFSYWWNTSLSSDGYHTIIVRAVDSAGNAGEPLARGFYVNNADQRAPALSSIVNGTVTDSYAIISWSTDENSSSQVEYGLSVSYGFVTGELDLSPRVLSHSVNLTGLLRSTLYHFRVRSRDASGNLNISADYNFTTSSVDTTAPFVNITAPAAGSSVNGNYSVNFSISDAGGVSPLNVSIKFDGGGWIATNSNFSYSWNTSLYSDGAHLLQVKAVDSSGNEGLSDVRLVYVNNLDRDAPGIFAVANSTTSTTATISWNTTESADAQVEYGIVSGSYVQSGLYAHNSTNHSVLLSSLSSGTTYFYRVKSRDSSGNLNTSQEFSFTTSSVDTTAPVVNITYPAAGSVVNGVVSVNFTVSDANGVSPQNVSISFDGGGWLATNSNFSYWWNTTLVADGYHTIKVRAIDSANNSGYSEPRGVYVNNEDQIAPVISSVANSTVTDSLAVITWSTDENASSKVEYGLSVSYGFATGELDLSPRVLFHSVNLTTGLSPGTLYHYRVLSRDASGNLNFSGDYNFTTSSVDTTAPFVNITYPVAGSAVNGMVSVNYTISDAGGVSPLNVSIKFDGGGWIVTNSNFSYWWNTTLVADGYHEITVRAVDSSGNAGEASIGAYVNNLDRDAPAIFNVSASANLTTALIAWNTSEPADAQVEFGVVSGSYLSTGVYSQNSTNHSVLLSGLQTGTLYFYRVKSRDASGNQNTSQEFNFTTLQADVAAPAISSVTNGTVTASLAVITWSTDENASSKVEYGLSVSYGFATGELDLSPRVLFHSVNLTTGLSPGTLYHYRVLSRDASGNLNFSGDYNFTTSSVDTTAPVVNITAPAAGSTVSGMVLIEYTISDSGGVNGSNVSISFDGGSWIVTNSNSSYSWDTFFFADGYSHTVKIRAVDSSGNIGYSESLVVIVRDQAAPGIYAVSNSTTSTTATISWNTTEPADAQVEYGTVSGSYTPSGLYADNSITHSVLISDLSPGTRYFYRVKSKDASLNLNTSEAFSFTTVFVDVTAPVVNITAPAAGSAVNGVVQINYSISDSSGVDGSNVSISFDGPSWIVTNSNSTYSWNTSLVADGYHIMQVRAFDLSGNLGSSGVLGVYVNNRDRDAPGIFAVTNSTTSTTATISWNTTEPADAQVAYGVLSGSYILTDVYSHNSTNHTVVLSGLSSGTRYYYKVKSRDNSGNPNASEEFSFTTVYNDSSAPSVAIVSPRGGDYIGLSKAIVVNVSDSSGIDDATIKLYKDGAIFHTYSPSECTGAGTAASPFVCTWLWNTADEDNGDHTLQLYASDLAGNSREGMLLLVHVDRVNPILPSSTAPSNNQYLYVSEPTVNFTVERGSQGLLNRSSISVVVDGQPAMDFSPASNCSLANGTNDYFCSFRITRYTHTQLGYVFNGSLMLGNHSLIISASDLAGNNATPRSVNFTLLDVNDTISVTSLAVDKSTAVANGADYWQYTFGVTLGYSAGTRVSFKLADWQDGYGHTIPAAYANISSGSSKVSVATSYIYSLPVSDSDPSTPGVQASLVLRQYIPVGTVTSQYSTSYGMKTMDSESPYLYSTSPANGSFLNYAIQNVTATLADPGGSGVYLDGSAISLSNASAYVPGAKLKYPPNGLVWNLSSPLPDGNYTIGAVPRDRYGNTGSAYYAYFVLDRVAPTAATLGPLPASGYTTSLLVSLNWSGASDDRSGVSHYQIWRSANSGPFVNIANTSAAAYNDIGVQNNVSYAYNLSTVDRAGNVQFSSVLRSTTIDITPPSAPVLNPLATPTGTPAVAVSGTAEPDSTVTVYLNGAVADTKVATGGTFTTNSFTLSEGSNTINATATDLAGLVSGGSAPLSVLLDTTPPSIGSLSPANNTNVSSAAPEISAVFNESGSGINTSTIQMWVDGIPVPYSYDPAAKKVSYVPAPLSEGIHNVSLWVKDNIVANPTSFVPWRFGVDLTPPPQISGLNVIQDTSTTMNLSWSASPAPDLAYYRVYRQFFSFSNVSSASLVNGSVISAAYRDSLLNSSTAYYYAVTAVDAVGNENSTVVSRYNTTLS